MIKKDDFDICIIGGGAAGLFALKKIADYGLKVLLIEIGDNNHKDESSFNLNFNQIGSQIYNGSKEGRSFGIGGTTYLWGGSLIPYTKFDFDKRDNFSQGYNSINNVFSQFNHYKTLEELLGKKPSSDMLFSWQNIEYKNSDFYEIKNVFIPFDKKDFSRKKIRASFTQITSHKVEQFILSKSNKKGGKKIVEGVVCLDLKNNKHKSFKAKHFFLCAGALESTFLISKLIYKYFPELNIHKNNFRFYFNDHLSTPLIKILTSGKLKILEEASKIISGGLIYGKRYIFKDSITRSFFHFVPDTKNSKSFKSIKEIANSIQQRRLPDFKEISALGSISGLLNYSKRRYIDNKLFLPNDTDLYLTYDFETPFSEERYLEFDHIKKQRSIKWGLSSSEESKIQKNAIKNGLTLLNHLGLNVNRDYQIITSDIWNPYDAYHPSGTLYKKENNLIEYPNLNFPYLKNLYVFSTASLPSAGTANPTYSLLMLISNAIESIFSKP